MELPHSAVGTGASRYEILARLATGGMAELYLARATAGDGVVTHVVLKRILPSRSHDPQFVTMFLDEAALAAQLHHPNIAQVFDIGRLGSSYFFTMEYVHGENARAVLQREYGLRRKVPVGHAITIAVGAATGLHHAHDACGADRRPLNIVHRDVSPANIMVSFDGAVKLVDFGVAKAAVRFHETRAGTIKGKIAYLSPEQCTGGKPVDRRSDVFSLGIVLYELLTVQRLFRRDSDFATMAAIVTDDVPPPSELRPDVPPEIDTVVMRALEKKPEDRFPTAGSMVEALERAAHRSGIALSVGGLGRYLRELFGVRPEPWIELESTEAMPAPVTVTGESMIQIPMVATPLGPVVAMLSPDALGPPPPIVGEVAEIEAALVRTVHLEGAGHLDDDDFLAARPAAPVRGKPRALPEELEDRPTVIDDRLPEMPTDLDETTPLEPIDPITPPRSVTALPGAAAAAPPRAAVPPRATAPPPPPPVPVPPVAPIQPPSVPTFLGQPPMPRSMPPATEPIAEPTIIEDTDEAWARDTNVAEQITTTRQPAVEPGGPTAGPRLPPGAPLPGSGPPRPGVPHPAPIPARAPRFRLSTKLLVAGIGVIVLALVIRAITHRTPRVDAVVQRGPSLPPAD